MTALITLLVEPCNLLSCPAEEFEKVLVTVTDSAANMLKVFDSPVINEKEFEGCDRDSKEEVDRYLWKMMQVGNDLQ